MSLSEWWCSNACGSFWKCLNALKSPVWPPRSIIRVMEMHKGGFTKKTMFSFSKCIPKKCHLHAKHCILCKLHGVHTSPITLLSSIHMRRMKLQKWPLHEKECSRFVTCSHNSVYTQLYAKIVNLEKSNRKLKHTSKKRKWQCKCKSNSDSEDSILLWSDGYGSTGELLSRQKKL